MSLASAFGRGLQWGMSLHEDFWPCLSALGGFYVSHWEKYVTGVMYLPWMYDIMELVGGLGQGTIYLISLGHQKVS